MTTPAPEGPYALKDQSTSTVELWSVMRGAERFYTFDKPCAEAICAELNRAYAAGAASRDGEVARLKSEIAALSAWLRVEAGGYISEPYRRENDPTLKGGNGGY